ncbi:MAG: ferrous iron transport protein B [Tepidisphaeraceae bacterium]
MKTAIKTVALAGNPNSGKTTIFNGLTGMRQKVANYPGVTVEKKTGRCRGADGSYFDVIDLPGTYSLVSRSPDEQVAMDVIRGLRADTAVPDAVVVVVDASNLQRNLYLVSQLIEMGKPMVVALNMVDVAERRGIHVCPRRLSQNLGVPVVPVVGHKKQGIKELIAAISQARVAPMPDWQLPHAIKEELAVVGGGLSLLDAVPVSCSPAALAERLLIGDTASDVAAIGAREPVASLLSSAHNRLAQMGIDPMEADIEAHYQWIDSVAAGSLVPACERLLTANDVPTERTLTDKVDAILVHKVWGLLIFALIMAALFVTIFWLAQPIMDAIQNFVTYLGNQTTGRMSEGPLKALLNDGVFAGVGTVVVFLPQIALLFLFLAILEDSGYLARAAFLMDRLLSKVGLHGKSFIPLLSSFACAIPGIMATRTIENRKDRLATILVAPFMSCSARLPVYTLLIGTFFAAYGAFVQAGVMLACYSLGIVAAVLTAWAFKRSFLKGAPTAFILELPSYKFPQPSQVFRQVWTNSSKFLSKAGTTIFCLSVVLWGLTYYGVSNTKLAAAQASGADDNTLAAMRMNESVAGRIGHWMEPALKPLGYNWKMGIGLVGAFAAREVFVSTMGITYAVGDVENGNTTKLASAMQADHYANGHAVWTPLVAVSLLVWFVLALQCMSTLAVTRRETGGWGWPIFMLVYMNALAYVVSLLVFQVGTHLLHA